MTRHDVSQVPPQGGYIAKQCPVRAQNDVLSPASPIPISAELRRRFDRGNEFENSALAQIEDLGSSTSIATSVEEAIETGVDLIVGPHLPIDHAGRRTGTPDLLVRAKAGGYRVVDIKHHILLDPVVAESESNPALCSELERPFLEDAVQDDALRARKHEPDLLQLAHYERILEAAGLSASDGRWGGVLGTDGRIVWFDLDAPIWRPKTAITRGQLQSTMEKYDEEFDFRLQVIAAAEAHKLDESTQLLVAPLRIAECPECPWWDYCRQQLEAGSGSVSLLPKIRWREWKIHHDHGVFDRAALGRLDIETAQLVAAGVNVAEMQSLIEDLPPEMPIGELGVVIRSKNQLARLEAAGVTTFGELARLCSTTASYSGSAMSSLAEHIDLARAALGPDSIYRRRAIETLTVPRADIEVDLDMENIEEGAYLWGALLTDRTHESKGSTYHHFATWDPLTPEFETANSLRFWSWFCQIRESADKAGQTLRAYCYNSSAENTYLRRFGLAANILDQVEAFIDSEQWVDLLRVVDSQLLTGGGMGLKKIAPLAGFAWKVEDPGGGISMLYHDTAVYAARAQDREQARQWLLSYNQGDVEATLHIRDWLQHDGESIASITTLDHQFSDIEAAS